MTKHLTHIKEVSLGRQYTTSSIVPSNGMLVNLFPDVIPPLGDGVLIGPQTLLVSCDEVQGLASYADGIYNNQQITFDLDMPGLATDSDNEDNWGVTEEGLAAKHFWDKGITGQGVKVGIADSGIDISHPAFSALLSEGRLSAFAAFKSNGLKQLQHNSDGSVIPDEEAIPTFTHWHGTHCAGIIIGNSTAGKLRGVAPAAKLAVAQVLQQGNIGTVASFFSGFNWLASQHCDVVSLSLGWPGKHEEWAIPIKALLQGGTVVVVAVGNEFGAAGVGPSRSPANYPIDPVNDNEGLLLSIGAHDRTITVWDSSGGEIVDWSGVTVTLPDGNTRPSVFSSAAQHLVPTMVAPGVDIISAFPSSKYWSATGSSMATPHIAGLIALVLSYLRANGSPNATPRNAANLLLNSLKPLVPGTETLNSGKGIADIDRLLSSLFH
jgi:subtilisin family serine protease